MIPINLNEKLACLKDYWHSGIVAQINNYHVKVAKFKGEFTDHDHPETDELFLVLKGSMVIRLPEGDVKLEQGELIVVSAGVSHQPIANEECAVLLLEPAGTRNTGSVTSKHTVNVDRL